MQYPLAFKRLNTAGLRHQEQSIQAAKENNSRVWFRGGVNDIFAL